VRVVRDVIQGQCGVPFPHRNRLVEFGGYVSAEDRVLRGPLIVHTSDLLFLVSVISARGGDTSCRIGSCTCPHGSVVVGRCCTRFTAAGLNSAGFIRLSTNPPRSAICWPPL